MQHYKQQELAGVEVDINWVLDGQADQLQEAIDYAITWDPVHRWCSWYKAVHALLNPQRHNPDVMKHLLKYCPYSFQYTARKLGRPNDANLPFPDGMQGASAVIPHLQWQLDHNRDSIEDAVEHVKEQEWHNAAYHLLEGQKQSPDVCKLYLMYFPYAIRQAAALIGCAGDVSIADPIFVPA